MPNYLLLIFTLFLPIYSYSDNPNSDNRGQTAHVAVASNFTPVMKALIQTFEATSPHKIKASYASSGKFYAQIHQGAPFHIFLSADQDKAIRLEQQGLTVADSRFTYALGQLALWSSNPDFANHELERLKKGDFNKLAIANPKLAPYGKAAKEVLSNIAQQGVMPLQGRIIKGENIAQTFQFVATHNADLGFVALSQVLYRVKQDPAISYWQVPVELYNPIKQDLVLLKSGSDNAAAKDFIQFIRTDKAQALIHAHGYGKHTP